MYSLHVYYVVLFKKFKLRIYLHSLQSDRRWAITRTFEKAFRFDYPHYAKLAIQNYCNLYGADKNDFRVLKVIEEDITEPKKFGE